MADKLIPPLRSVPHYRNGLPEQRVSDFFNDVAERINNVAIEGSGTPEGNVSAPRLTFYFDNTNDLLYIKKSQAGSNTGWVQI